MKLRDAIATFLSGYQNAGTREAYQYCLHPLRDYIGPDRPLADIAPVDLVQWTNIIRSDERGYSLAYQRKHIRAIKTFFNRMVEWELIDISPARNIRGKKLPTYISRDKAMTNAELEAILEAVQFKPRDTALILFLADTGARAGGAATLTVDHLSLDERQAFVTEKGDKSRPVAYGIRTANALRIWLLHRPAAAGPYVFSSRQTALKSHVISQIIRRACIAAGVRSLGSHSLRHRKGHQLADARTAPSIAATALGHSDPVITLQHYYPADWESALRELRNLAMSDPQPAEETPIIPLNPAAKTGTK